jgi:hypothetical protein
MTEDYFKKLYSGFKDKYGRKIYSDDNILSPFMNIVINTNKTLYSFARVHFVNGEFCLTDFFPEPNDFLKNCHKSCIVIDEKYIKFIDDDIGGIKRSFVLYKIRMRILKNIKQVLARHK